MQAAIISTAVTGSCVAASIVAARAMHEPRLRNVIRQFNHRALNPLTLRFAGARLRVYAKLQHTGRRTGRAYSTPVVAHPLGDGFVVPLPYGATTDWCRNVMAADGCQLTWSGQTYTLDRPELIPATRALHVFPRMQRLIFSTGGIEWFVWLHQARAEAEIARAAMGADMPAFDD